MRLLLEEVEPAYANALRRVLVSDVPKMAIEDVEFHLGPIRADDGKEYESVGPLFDEMIAHRLGLVPIPTDLALYNRREDCPTCHGEGCPSCTIIYAVHVDGGGRDAGASRGLRDVREVPGAVQSRVCESRERSDADRDGVRDGRVHDDEVGLARVPRHLGEAVFRARDASHGPRMSLFDRSSTRQVLIRLLSI